MKKHAGLTLIEVLIAGLLLAMALGVASVVFQQNDLQQRQAERILLRASQLDSVVNRIRYELQQGAVQGEWTLSDMPYAWQAKVIRSAAVAGAYDAESGGLTETNQQKSLYQVDVSSGDNPLYSFQLTL
ncbi:PulJ/GspJ family protein [Rheinheimera baltica]|uniref:PulJ/GspJ family protein n=1 Tax=Rheinheimera baltica TaxID=67576 RepID=UPI00041EB934|nr:prepilin-type N-terminal cleavage/methylation domain-containing protein [Rheinheimera baltica]MDP5143110.1 prepilin-type N-terminal cleavage/methylation domain-containing protein [Rheinheimera baltica]MDP5190711.1 prepilin-type N-terminal cleavage/methylation domain-containing protein [Rheinheimera baltica]